LYHVRHSVWKDWLRSPCNRRFGLGTCASGRR
jgi:hypothetical protein